MIGQLKNLYEHRKADELIKHSKAMVLLGMCIKATANNDFIDFLQDF